MFNPLDINPQIETITHEVVYGNALSSNALKAYGIAAVKQSLCIVTGLVVISSVIELIKRKA